MRIFYSDHGGDKTRLAKTERWMADLIVGGARVMRTGVSGPESVAEVLPVPSFAKRSKIRADIRLSATDIGADPAVALAAAIFHGDNPDRNFAECYTSMYAYRAHLETELRRFGPDLAIAWHQFSAYHTILQDCCHTLDIPVMFAEHGVLPGSWCFEFGGQMGESWPAQKPAAFAALPVDAEDLVRAEAYLDHAVAVGLNRKTDTITVEESGLGARLRDEKRHRILYAGANDTKTGLQPFSAQRSLLHGGDFLSTGDGLLALLRLARRQGLVVLYKPHPSLKDAPEIPEAFRKHVIVVDRRVNLVDLLQHVDLLATIVSQSAYMAALHGKPVLLMGRIQLSGTGIAEEAPFRADLEAALTRALANSDPAGRARLLRAHVARLLRHYLIADDYPAADPEGSEGKAGRFFPYNLGTLAQALPLLDLAELRRGQAA